MSVKLEWFYVRVDYKLNIILKIYMQIIYNLEKSSRVNKCYWYDIFIFKCIMYLYCKYVSYIVDFCKMFKFM